MIFFDENVGEQFNKSISKLLLPATGSHAPESNILVIASVNLNSIFLGWPEGCSNALSTVVCFADEVDRAFLEGGCAGWSSTLWRFLELAPGFAVDIRCIFSALSFALKKSTWGTQCNPLEAMKRSHDKKLMTELKMWWGWQKYSDLSLALKKEVHLNNNNNNVWYFYSAN